MRTWHAPIEIESRTFLMLRPTASSTMRWMSPRGRVSAMQTRTSPGWTVCEIEISDVRRST